MRQTVPKIIIER
jgi:hypothetical protein